MKTIGIFEAKAKLSEICDEVARSGRSVVVTRRGRPLVQIDPISARKTSVWEVREEYEGQKGRFREEFDLPPRSRELPAGDLDD